MSVDEKRHAAGKAEPFRTSGGRAARALAIETDVRVPMLGSRFLFPLRSFLLVLLFDGKSLAKVDPLNTACRGFSFLWEQLVLNWIKPERLAHARKAAAMNWRRPEFFQTAAMFRSRIAFVGGKIVAGMD